MFSYFSFPPHKAAQLQKLIYLSIYLTEFIYASKKRNIVIVKLLVYNIHIETHEGGESMRIEGIYIGLTVKEILTDKLGFSKRAIADLKNRPDGITVNGEHVTVRKVLREGDILIINCDDEDLLNEKLIPSNVLPDIIYEDDDIVLINKPPFMPTHQSQGHFTDTLANSLAYHYALLDRPFVFRSINRLDRNTSGIVLVAKNRSSAAKLSEQMKNGEIRKTYLALLDGVLEQEQGRIETHIRRREKSIILREICEPCEDSQIAITDYRTIALCDGITLVETSPITGRTHQLRVHFSHLGAQILGDDLYGNKSNLIDRHALHAHKLTFKHPSSAQELTFFAPLPHDMKSIIEDKFGKDLLLHGRK